MSAPDVRGPAGLPRWQARAWRTLAARAQRGSLPHALLLGGERGLGKRAFVENFIHACLCAHPRDGVACGRCRTCALLTAGTHPDFILITFEVNERTHKLRSEIVVEQIRALSARLAMASQLGGWQIALVDPADAMNPAASNAMLKTLEEPNASSLIVLVADQPWRLPATIRSRCQRIDFTAPARAEAEAWLHEQGIDDVALALDAAGGNPGRALAFARDGELQRRAAVAGDLAALAAGRVSVQATAKAWAADEPAARLEHAARWLSDAARNRANGTTGAFDPGWDMPVLQAAFAHANRLREQLRGPLRAEPALVELFGALPRAS